MSEPALSAQPLTGRNVAQTDSGNALPAHEPRVGMCSGSDNKVAHRPNAPREEAEQSLHTDEQSLHTEVRQLRRAMQTRPTIDQACGMLMATFGLSPQTAWSVLVAVSQNTNTKLHCLASDLVGTVQGDPLPKAVQEQMAAAVAKANATSAPRGSRP
jgi:hypothetical protein